MVDKAKVYLGRVQDYTPEPLEEKLREGLNAIGGIREIVSGKKVFVKINQLANRPPEEAVTTHPILVEKVIKILLEAGAKVTIGDDIENKSGEDGFLITGMREISQRYGVGLINLRASPYEKITIKDNKFLKELYVSKPVLEAEVIVNLPKFKTHSQTTLTAAIKNTYGFIPLGERGRFHANFPRIEDFSQAVVDVFNACRPRLNIMDGVCAMEGEGPMAGTPRWLGIILISRDAVALDTVASSLIGLKPGAVRHIFQAGARGLGCSDLKRVDILGEEASKLVVLDFKLPKIMWQAAVPKFLSNLIYQKISLRPHIFRKECSLCAECSQRCPVGAMAIKERKLIIDYRLCIGCLCCQEICSSRAIMSRRSPLGEALLKGFRALQKMKERLFIIFLIIFLGAGCRTIPVSEEKSLPAEAPLYLRYIVQKGDTLWKISRMAYNDSRKWPKIHKANSDKLKSITELKPGEILLIPLD